MFKFKVNFTIDIDKFFENKERPQGKQKEKEGIEFFVMSLCKVRSFRLRKFDSDDYGFSKKGDKFLFEVFHNLPKGNTERICKKYKFLDCEEEALSKEEQNDLRLKSKGRRVLHTFK